MDGRAAVGRGSQAKRILSVSYDRSLLGTRHILLQRAGYVVNSVVGFADALHECQRQKYDLLIICHSIPHSDKIVLIRSFKRRCPSPILAMRLPGEPRLDADVHSALPHDPEEFLGVVEEITGGAAGPAKSAD